jgi:16S rRNA (cytosine1402-N4)-methyltransferase
MPHIPVLLNEIMQYLDPKPGDTILDATLGGGGYAREVLKKIGDEGRLIGIDQDETVIKNIDLRFKNQDLRIPKNAILINGNFRDLDKHIESLNIKKLNGVLFDFGMSSLQLEESKNPACADRPSSALSDKDSAGACAGSTESKGRPAH